MKDITKRWVELARADLDAASTQFCHGAKRGSSYQIAVFHCHQAIEKLLKAFWVEQNTELRKTHDLTYLRTAIDIEMPSDIMVFIDKINPHYLLPRYPDLPFTTSFVFTYNRKNVEAILKDTKQAYLWLEKKLMKKK